MEKIISDEFVILGFNIKQKKNIRNCNDILCFNKQCVEKNLYLANAKNTVL